MDKSYPNFYYLGKNGAVTFLLFLLFVFAVPYPMIYYHYKNGSVASVNVELESKSSQLLDPGTLIKSWDIRLKDFFHEGLEMRRWI